MLEPVLNKPADIKTIRKWYQEGLLSEEAFKMASQILRPSASWFAWAKQMLLFFGCALVLAGIIFFFAYNWAAMGKFLKFGIIEVGIIGCIYTSYRKDKNSLSGKVLLLSAAVLVGVLLAVYGQTYQTGADAFGLFLGWAGLIFAWVIISDFAALWLIWLILLNTGAILYWLQIGEPTYSVPHEYLCLGLAVLNGSALFSCEIGVQKGFVWLKVGWLRCILLVSVLVALSIPVFHFIFEFGDNIKTGSLSGLVWLAVAIGGYYCYRRILPDMVAIAVIMMNVCVMLLSFIGKLLFSSGVDGGFLFLLFSAIIIGVVTGAVFLLKDIAKQMSGEIEGSAK